MYTISLGDLGELKKHGSIHEYAEYLHEDGTIPVTSFWWATTQVVSVCSPQAFKELAGLLHRPRKKVCEVCGKYCDSMPCWNIWNISGCAGDVTATV